MTSSLSKAVLPVFKEDGVSCGSQQRFHVVPTAAAREAMKLGFAKD